MPFPLLEPGQEHFDVLEKYTLLRHEDSPPGRAIYEIRFGNGVSEHYAPHPTDGTRWQLQHITGRDYTALYVLYTPQGWLRGVQNDMHEVRCILDDAGRITAVHLVGNNPLKLASYVYDENGDLVEATDRAGRQWRYTYQHHLLTSYRTPGGATYVSEWDGDTPQAKVVRTYGYTDDKNEITRETRFAYEPVSKTTRVTDALGRVTEYHYNGLWAVDRTLYPDGSMTQTHFDETGSVSGYTDELGRTTHFVNDERGNTTTVIDAAGNITRMRYNSLNLPEQVTDAAGQVWQSTYDKAGHLLTQTDPLGNVTSYTYDEHGLPATRTDAMGGESRQQWSAAGLCTIVTPMGLGTWKMQYDKAARLITKIDPLERKEHVQWNAYGERIRVIDAAGGMRRYQYDVLGRLIQITNAKGEKTTFGYDSRDRVITQTGFDGRKQTWQYNAAGEMTQRTNHSTDGQIVTQVISDALGRPVGSSSSDGSQTSYRYDARGALTQAQASAPGNAPVQVTYEYDAAGRRVAEVQAHHNRVWRISHELDALGHRSSTRIPDAGTLMWQRYGSGHVHGVLLDSDALANFERDKLHREIQRVQGSVTHTLGYLESGRLAQHQWQDAHGAAKPWRGWEYDRTGQITQLQDAMRGTKRYQYDDLSRLTDVGGEHFGYDATNNLVKVGHNTNGQGRATGDRLEVLMLGQEPVQYGYDGHGNRITRVAGKNTTRYHYDGMHQLKKVELADGTKANYEYDALGRRIAKHVTQNGETKTTLFVWDGNWLVQEISNGSAITYVKYPNHARPLAKLENGKVYHYVTDHLGTPQEIHDAQGKVVWAAEYNAYGTIRRHLAHEISNPIRFAGQYFDDETGLHYNRFRYYDPQAGRYVNPDPIGLKGGWNQFAYVNVNPVNRIDSLGLQVAEYIPPVEYSSVNYLSSVDSAESGTVPVYFSTPGEIAGDYSSVDLYEYTPSPFSAINPDEVNSGSTEGDVMHDMADLLDMKEEAKRKMYPCGAKDPLCASKHNRYSYEFKAYPGPPRYYNSQGNSYVIIVYDGKSCKVTGSYSDLPQSFRSLPSGQSH